MNFQEAFNAMLEGKKIRRREWETLMHIRIQDGKPHSFVGDYTNFRANADILTSTGWLIVGEDEKEFSFIEAIEQLKNKKRIRNKEWGEEFIFIDNDTITLCKKIEYNFMPTYQCMCANDWEIMP